MREVCLDPNVSDPFVWSNDDIFWLASPSLVELMHESGAALGKLREVANRGLHGRRAHATADILEQEGLPTWNYERHVPLLVHKDEMLRALDLGGSKRSVYGNLLLPRGPIAVTPDVKLFKGTDPVGPDWSFVSVGNHYPLAGLRTTLGL